MPSTSIIKMWLGVFKMSAEAIHWWGQPKKHTNPCARVYHNANQSIPNATPTFLAFNSEFFDNDGIHDNVTNNERLTCKTAGKYLVIGQVRWNSIAGGRRQIGILLNSTEVAFAESGSIPDTEHRPIQIVSTILDLAVGDYVRLRVYQSSGDALNVVYASSYSPIFSMVWLSL